jgi:hypothetical protein
MNRYEKSLATLPSLLFLLVLLLILDQPQTRVAAELSQGLLYKPRSKWTARELADYERCRRKRRAQKKSLRQFYLVQNSRAECRENPPGVMDINKFVLLDHKTKTKVLKFPGSYDIAATMNINGSHPLIKKWHVGKIPNIAAHVSWTFTTGGSSNDVLQNLTCRNTDLLGCNGAGNKCTYCNFCLEVVRQAQKNVRKSQRAECPRGPGFQKLLRTGIKIDGWGELDKDNDNEPDFTCYPEFRDFPELLPQLGVQGYGNVYLRFSLSRNDTVHFRRLKAKYNNQVNLYGPAHAKELKHQLRKNLLGCVIVTFDICGQKPVIVNGKPRCQGQ